MRGAMTGDTSEDYARRRVRELTEEIKRLHAEVLYEQERNHNNVHAYQERIDAALALHMPNVIQGKHQRFEVCPVCSTRDGDAEDSPCPTVKALKGEK